MYQTMLAQLHLLKGVVGFFDLWYYSERNSSVGYEMSHAQMTFPQTHNKKGKDPSL